MLLLSFALIIGDLYSGWFRAIKQDLALLVYPVQWVVDTSQRSYKLANDYLRSYELMQNQNAKLLEENIIYKSKLQKLDTILAENKMLRSLFDSYASKQDDMLLARVMGVSVDLFADLLMLNKGKSHGLYLGQTVIDSDGIVGSVVNINKVSSKVLLLTDVASAIPVVNMRNGLRSVAVGTGRMGLELKHLPLTADVKVGDIFVSSGMGGKFPENYPVAMVTDVTKVSDKPFAQVTLHPKAKLKSSNILLMLNPRNVSAND